VILGEGGGPYRAGQFTHEAQELQMAGLFFDEQWWTNALGRRAPGLAGAGNGLGLVPGPGGFASELG
jgi:hypothetical protein